MINRISLAMLPGEAAWMDADCFIVVDTLRATTTIATLFAGGISELWVASTIEQARRLAAEHDALLLGEVGGLPPEGFDFGNSPVELAAADLSVKRAVLFTTNGTKALCGLASQGVTYAGALVNATAVAAAADEYEHACLVCAGESRGQRFALEDFAAAAEIVRRLAAHAPHAVFNDGAELGMELDRDETTKLIGRAHHAEALRRLGLDEDIAFASNTDTMTCVPMVAACGDGWALLRDAATSRDA
jgi:2-phosphosulfolactate phosphatase